MRVHSIDQNIFTFNAILIQYNLIWNMSGLRWKKRYLVYRTHPKLKWILHKREIGLRVKRENKVGGREKEERKIREKKRKEEVSDVMVWLHTSTLSNHSYIYLISSFFSSVTVEYMCHDFSVSISIQDAIFYQW